MTPEFETICRDACIAASPSSADPVGWLVYHPLSNQDVVPALHRSGSSTERCDGDLNRH